MSYYLISYILYYIILYCVTQVYIYIRVDADNTDVSIRPDRQDKCESKPIVDGANKTHSRDDPKGSRSGFMAEWFFGGLGYQGHQTRTFSRNKCVLWPCRRRRQGPKSHSFLENVWFLGLGTPGLENTTWPKKHFGITVRRLRLKTPQKRSGVGEED